MISILFFLFSLPLFSSVRTPVVQPNTHTLAERKFSLENRYKDPDVNNVFKDNILLAINYTVGRKVEPKNIDWEKINSPFRESIILEPGETFAFHDDVLPQFDGKVSKTTNAHFNHQEGFKSDGYLVGDGVCHLASFLYLVTKDAGLNTLAPTRHDFASIPDVPREFGVSIYSDNQVNKSSDTLQNLYITNTKAKQIAINFDYDGKTLTISTVEKI